MKSETGLPKVLWDYFRNPVHKELIDFLKSQGLQFHISEDRLSNRTEKLNGLNIVISGTFNQHSRDELKQLIEQNGGKNVSSISKKSNYLLAGENMGPSKLEKANTTRYSHHFRRRFYENAGRIAIIAIEKGIGF